MNRHRANGRGGVKRRLCGHLGESNSSQPGLEEFIPKCV
jgi:hypothetical protein